MSEKSHKRKRSIQDTPVDLTKMQLAKHRLVALQEELAGVQETEGAMEEVMRHVDALVSILGTGEELVSVVLVSSTRFAAQLLMYLHILAFPSLRYPDLENMGVKINKLRFQRSLPGAETSKRRRNSDLFEVLHE